MEKQYESDRTFKEKLELEKKKLKSMNSFKEKVDYEARKAFMTVIVY